MVVKSCMPVIPSADLEKSLRFWVDGLGLTMDRPMREDGRLIGCIVHNESLYFWLNRRAGAAIKPENYNGIKAANTTLAVTHGHHPDAPLSQHEEVARILRRHPRLRARRRR